MDKYKNPASMVTYLPERLAMLGVLHCHLLLQILEPLINLSTKNQ